MSEILFRNFVPKLSEIQRFLSENQCPKYMYVYILYFCHWYPNLMILIMSYQFLLAQHFVSISGYKHIISGQLLIKQV